MTDPAAPNRPRKFPWWIYWTTLIVILVVALWPAVSVSLAYLIADANHCRIDEEAAHPCFINGQDWGAALHSMGVMGWFMLATIPFGVFGFLAWMRTLFAHRATWRRSRKGEI